MTSLTAILAVALALDLAPRPAPAVPKAGHAPEETRCGACHTTEGWDRVTFDHARTGFPLDGQHRQAACRGCHAGSDFKRAVPSACVACHRDVHAGRLGTRCRNCHDAVAWKETTFGPEAHRRTNFPLDGRHAVLPCEECHGDRRDRGFSRPTRRCADCHQADLIRAAAGAFDHSPPPTGWDFTGDCRRCHGAWNFASAGLAGHDACFPIRSGRHAGIRCLRCHTSLDPLMRSSACSDGDTVVTATADCRRCHGCPGEHPSVSGFNCASPTFSQDCWDCHPTGKGGD
jgi:hypothetical protein